MTTITDCPHIDSYDADDDGPRWLVCTLPAGHGGDHQLAVSTAS
jgi:hypothetical protein